MALKRPKSLKRLIFIHEAAFLFLVAVTGLLGGLSAYFWQQNSSESVRINALFYLTEQIRGELYAQIQEVIRARLFEDPRALEVYSDYSKRIDDYYNILRRKTETKEESLAIQELQLSYREIQKDMNKVFSDPYITNQLARIKIIDPAFAQSMLGRFEYRSRKFKNLLSKEHKELDRILISWTKFAPIIMPIPLILAILLVLYTRLIVNRGIIKPMSAVIAGAQLISQGRLDHKILEKKGVEEVSSLSETLNTMASKLAQSRDALVESEKQAVLGALVPVVAHNIRNPLASIRATAQLLDDADNREELEENKRSIIDTIDRLGRWINALVSYLHPLKPNLKLIKVNQLLIGSINMLEGKLSEKNITVTKTHWNNDHELQADPDLMEQALYGLINNAIDASPESGRLEIKIERREEYIEIHIIDEGPGLRFKPKPGTLEPGPSTKRLGTGLGIPIAFKICQSHGWNIQFKSSENEGTQVIIAAPVVNIEEAGQP